MNVKTLFVHHPFTHFLSRLPSRQNPLASSMGVAAGAGEAVSADNSDRGGSRVESPVDGATPSTNSKGTSSMAVSRGSAPPTASAAPTIPEATPESLKQVFKALDKRRRNLEKRKEKLAEYKVKLDAGENLNKDQREAASHFDEVINLLYF